MSHLNEFDQPVGEVVAGWSPRQLPTETHITGSYCRLELLDLSTHAEDLFEAHSLDTDGRNWTYIPVGPFENKSEFIHWAQGAVALSDPRHYAVIDLQTNKATGTLALMRHDPANGVIEVGYVLFSPLLQRTRVSTEAQYLLMKYVFDDLGYRRYEWKCDSHNIPSQKTATRLGFKLEGIFRNHIVYKGRNRDTAWYSITREEWPEIKNRISSWLMPENFDSTGAQLKPLRANV
ncbi:GNAT family N-acetyltransferase [Aurantimicrobium minutum]|uniref:GNAT family N-acetyltransferase n=1 Tax=Aurantimicrobium minutum TaxID=708131 RepID=UPI002475D62C|nr:GNAT family protein [Aurantimicrobium minutum]MDH6423348.1 RimJ/RimL family protein N-acetyltransferase [Aurantimicrobium minutum]